MSTSAIRKKLLNYLEVADDKKIKAMYIMMEDDIEKSSIEYTKEFKDELDRRHAWYKSGGKMVSATEANRQIKDVLKKGGRK
jgi:hypothetical protein